VYPSSARRAKAITILNLKGGVGKTHTSWLLSAVCQEQSRRLLAVDLDTQGNLSNSFLNGQDPVPGVEMFFHPGVDAEPNALIRNTAFSAIDLIPASARVAPYTIMKFWFRQVGQGIGASVTPVMIVSPRSSHMTTSPYLNRGVRYLRVSLKRSRGTIQHH